MNEDLEKAMAAFDLFETRWALVTAGSMEHFNGCTVGWGSLGNLWNAGGKKRPVITLYVHPARYTGEFLEREDLFTVSFFGPEYRKALGYMGSHSGRNGNKAALAGLTPVPIGASVTYREAETTFLCRKLYLHQFDKASLSPEIQAYYASRPEVFPAPNGGWQPHLMILGEVVEIAK